MAKGYGQSPKKEIQMSFAFCIIFSHIFVGKEREIFKVN